MSDKIYIDIDFYDESNTLVYTSKTCRYFKVIKNTLSIEDRPYYNQYQFIFEIPDKYVTVFNQNTIFNVKVYNAKQPLLSVFITPTHLDKLRENTMSTIFNIIGVGTNIFNFLNDDILCRVSDYDQFFQIYKIPRTSFNTSYFNFLQEGIFKLMNNMYGPFIMDTYLKHDFINDTSVTLQNLPTMDNNDLIYYYFKNFHPVLDYTFFGIDDCVPFHDINSTSIYTGITSKIILNSFSNVLNSSDIILSKDKKYRVTDLNVENEIDITFFEKYAYGDYIVHDVDNPLMVKGVPYSRRRVFNGNLRLDEIISANTVFFDYSIDRISLEKLRKNYSTLLQKVNSNIAMKIINSPIELMEVNKVFSIDSRKYYIYAGEYEFKPDNELNSERITLILNSHIKCLEI